MARGFHAMFIPRKHVCVCGYLYGGDGRQAAQALHESGVRHQDHLRRKYSAQRDGEAAPFAAPPFLPSAAAFAPASLHDHVLSRSFGRAPRPGLGGVARDCKSPGRASVASLAPAASLSESPIGAAPRAGLGSAVKGVVSPASARHASDGAPAYEGFGGGGEDDYDGYDIAAATVPFCYPCPPAPPSPRVPLPPPPPPDAHAWASPAAKLVALKHKSAFALYHRGLESSTSLAEMDRWLTMFHGVEWETHAFGPSARCTLPTTADTVRTHARLVMNAAGILPVVHTTTTLVGDPRGGNKPPSPVRVFHVDLGDLLDMMLADTVLNNAATLVFPGSSTAKSTHPACSKLDAWRQTHVVSKFAADAARLFTEGKVTSPDPFVAGFEIGADATGAQGFEPLYARLLNGPFAALDDPRATLLFALVDYPEPPAGLSQPQAALFRMECVQAALRVCVIDGLEVRTMACE